MRTRFAVPWTGVVLAAVCACGSGETPTSETTEAPTGSFNEELLAQPVRGVEDCPSGYSTGYTGEYQQGGGESTLDEAIAYLSKDVAREHRQPIPPQIVARSSTGAIVEYSKEQDVVGRGELSLVAGKWQIYGMSVCTLHPGVPDQDRAK